MKTTLRYAAFAVFFALFALPPQIHAKVLTSTAVAKDAAPKTYIVNFNANGGKGKMSPQLFTVDKPAKLAANNFTRNGYVFRGWSTSKTGPVDVQKNQMVINLTKGGRTITLYAQWAVQDYLVAFFANGGSGSMPLQKHTYGKSATLTPNRFTRKGYSFTGWATSSKGSVVYADKASVQNLTRSGSTVKLYAVWMLITTYTVNFNANGGTGKMSPQKFTVDKSAKLAANCFTRSGYVFRGWSMSENGPVNVQKNQVVTNLAPGGETITLYAQWAVQDYFVAFYANGGSGSMPVQNHTYGKAATLTPNRFTRDGYLFAGWATKQQGPVTYTNKASVQNLARDGRTIKLYAVWEVDPAAALPGDQVDFAQLNWSYGGFNGSAAKVSDRARISDLKASDSGLSYSWVSGGCQDLGASSATDASCLACVFCLSGGKWTGGKFDWICTNDKSPSFKNIIDQYKGWSSAVLSKAEEYAFVIVSKDGKTRTNVIRVKSPGFSTPTAPTTPATPAPTTPASSSADEVDFSLLQWTYGNFKGGDAKLGSQPRISGLKVNNSGMSYSWKSGGCENLGCSSSTDASCIAALFCYYGGKWIGGKFDWVSTSRRTRDFKNVHDGYNGWSPTVFKNATAYAFVIVSKDGKSRSNVIRCGR